MFSSDAITFSCEALEFDLKEVQKVEEWIAETIGQEEKLLGEIAYVFCSDDYLLSLNKEYLNHDTLTDIITFNYCEGNQIHGDIFISIERVKENAVIYNTTFEKELHRVMIHGILHLLGYNDKTAKEKELMRTKENFYLTLLS